MLYVRAMVIPMKDKVVGELHIVMKEDGIENSSQLD